MLEVSPVEIECLLKALDKAFEGDSIDAVLLSLQFKLVALK